MERLLAQSRRRRNDEPSPSPEPRGSQPAPPPPACEQPRMQQTDEAPLPIPATLEPRHRADPQETRASLDSLRQVANLSARSAIASATWKRVKSQLVFEVVLAATCFGVSGMLFAERWRGAGEAAFWLGSLAAGLGAVVSAEIVRTTGWLKRKPNGEAPRAHPHGK